MKFSVVIPAYNREDELPRSIESVLTQTYGEFELIIVDNGSTDNTKELVESYMKKDKRVKYFWQENSGSPAGSRNTGIKNSACDWVAFLDSDDYWYNNKLEEVHKIITQNPDKIAVSHYEDKETNGEIVSRYESGKNLSPSPYFELLFIGNSLSTSAMVVRKDKLFEAGLFDERRDYFAVEDYDLWMKLSRIGKFYYIKEALGVFVINDTNMSGNIDLINGNLKTLVLNHIDKLEVEDKERLKRKHGSRIEYYRARAYQIGGDFGKAREIILGSIKMYPWNIKKYVLLLYTFFKIKK